MTVDEAIKQIAEEQGFDEHVVRRVYYSVFEFIKDTVIEMPLKEELLDKKEFEKLDRVFYIPGLGKVTIPYTRYKKIWEAYQSKRNKNKKREDE